MPIRIPSYGESAAQVIPPLIGTILFYFTCRPVFQRPMTVLSVRFAADLDHNELVALQVNDTSDIVM